MRLASYRDGSRDGQLVVVSRDGSLAHYATGIATRLQQVLDDWNFLAPQLEDLSLTLNHGKARHAFAFDPRHCMAPLPRAFHWCEAVAEGSAAPMLRPGRGDEFLGPTDPVVLPHTGVPEMDRLSARGQIAVACGDLSAGSEAAVALDSVRLLMLACSLHLNDAPGPAGAVAVGFAPLALTPDELDGAWAGGRPHLALDIRLDGKPIESRHLGDAPPWHVGELLATLARHRGLRAGCVVGAGAPAPADGGPVGIALAPGERIRFEVSGRDGGSLFGAIDHLLAPGG
jgi:fumarylacetoacetate (FAA) hydrolase